MESLNNMDNSKVKVYSVQISVAELGFSCFAVSVILYDITYMWAGL